MKRLVVWITACALALLAGTLVTSGALAAKTRNAPIRLVSGTFVPTRGESMKTESGLEIAESEAAQSGYYIVQFKGPVREAWKQSLESQGVEFLDYIPDFAFKVRAHAASQSALRNTANIAWVGAFQPAYKLSPDLKKGPDSAYKVRIEQGADVAATIRAIGATGAQIFEGDEDIVYVAAGAAQLNALAKVADVAWIENYALNVKHNDYGGGVIIGSATANTNGYDGSTQIAAVADTGLGDGTKNGAHPDIPAARIVSINNWPGKTNICFSSIENDGPVDVDSGHGTHTSGSVLSDGGAAGEGKGVAPAAHLVFQATENWAQLSPLCQTPGEPTAGYFLTGLPDKLNKLFQEAYNDGARVHSNSWGSDAQGDYTANSAEVDQFMWKHKDMTITFSNGNSGTDANQNGVTDFGSVGSPATAKNVISVGASENDRQGHYECDTDLHYKSHDLYQPDKTCDDMHGQNLLGTYGERYPDDFPTNPLKNDKTAGNAEQLAAWSSRGPADDGRIKPDLVAPGTWVLSTSASPYQQGYGDPKNPKLKEYSWDGWGVPRSEFYKYMGGTSMSNPLVAGAATVVRDFIQKEYSFGATSALVKALLINSAHDELDENNDGHNDNDFPIPNNHEGWGRVDLATATNGEHGLYEVSEGLATKQKYNDEFSVPGGAPLKITVVWTDQASTESAGRNLVNDLDLIVTSPSGAKYKGNIFANGWSKTKGKADRVNNVENVYIENAEAGTWKIQVKGFNVPKGPQPFALVVAGINF